MYQRVSKSLHIDRGSESGIFNDDLFDRRDAIVNLTKVFGASIGPCVLAVVSPWGSGKTEFVRMWEAYLRLQGHATFYYDAWMHDHASDPLLSLIAEICDNQSGEGGDGTLPARAISLRNSAFKYLRGKTPALLGMAVRVLSGGLMSGKLIETIATPIADAASETAAALSEVEPDDYSEYKNAMCTFKVDLAALINSLSQPGKRGFFFVDELDRCDPVYSMLLLERIKHLFDIDNLTFVLAVDSRHLDSIVHTRYGESANVVGYIEKFVDYQYLLPAVEGRRYFETLVQRALKNWNREYEESYGWAIRQTGTYFINRYELPLRSIERLVSEIMLFAISSNNDFIWSAFLLPFFIFLRKCSPQLYSMFKDPAVDMKTMFSGVIAELKEGRVRSIGWGLTYIYLSKLSRDDREAFRGGDTEGLIALNQRVYGLSSEATELLYLEVIKEILPMGLYDQDMVRQVTDRVELIVLGH